MRAKKVEHEQTSFDTAYGSSTLHCFRFGDHEEDHILVVAVPTNRPDALVRVQSACYTAEIFRSKDCDCRLQLSRSLRRIHKEGGLLIYMICDGRGAGLLTKVRGLALGAAEGLDTYDAYERLGVEPDPRNYRRVAKVLQHFGIESVRLLTNNPAKVSGLRQEGVQVTPLRLRVKPTEGSFAYLATKQLKFNHDLGLDV